MSFATILNYAFVAVVFLTMISILVAAHEYGHYYFARLFKMGVEEFAIGMGKKLKVWGKRRHDIAVSPDYVHDSAAVRQGAAFEGGNVVRDDSEVIDTPAGKVLRETTEFTVRALPIGGFVRIKGMVPQDDGSEVDIPGGFYNKPPWQRLIVLFAGPVASVVSGVLVLIFLYMIHGQSRPLNEPILGVVEKGGPAAKAGFVDGDRITAIDGIPMNTFYDVVQVVYASPGKSLKVAYLRKGEPQHTILKPEAQKGLILGPDLKPTSEEPRMRGAMLVAYDIKPVRLGFGEAVVEACNMPIEAVKGIGRIVAKPSRMKEEAGGAITMARATYAATMSGVSDVIELACLLSISVGIFNLLPIPPLDGGQMLMAFAELMRRGRRLSMQVQQALMSAGVALVLMLAVAVLIIDIQRVAKTSDKPVAPTSKPDKTPAANPGK